MKKLMIGLALGTFVALVAASAPAYAQSDRENSTFTVTEPVDVGSFTLQPGTYLIKVVLLESNRNLIQITNEDRRRSSPASSPRRTPSCRTKHSDQPLRLLRGRARPAQGSSHVVRTRHDERPGHRLYEAARHRDRGRRQGARDRRLRRGEGSGVEVRAPPRRDARAGKAVRGAAARRGRRSPSRRAAGDGEQRSPLRAPGRRVLWRRPGAPRSRQPGVVNSGASRRGDVQASSCSRFVAISLLCWALRRSSTPGSTRRPTGLLSICNKGRRRGDPASLLLRCPRAPGPVVPSSRAPASRKAARTSSS